jgi:hypothetical protein
MWRFEHDLTLLGRILTLSESEDKNEGDMVVSSEFDPVVRLVGDLGKLLSPFINEELSLFILGERIAGEVEMLE